MLITLYVFIIFTANRTVHSNFLNDMPESTSELVLHYIFQLLTPGGFHYQRAPDFVSGKLVAISGVAGRSAASFVMNELKVI